MATAYGSSRNAGRHRVYRPMANFRTNTASPFRHIDLVLVGCVLAVSLFGALMVYSTTRGPTPPYDDGYLKRVPVDPWGNPYQYLAPGTRGAFDLYSLGADGKEGGSDHDADIGNWAL